MCIEPTTPLGFKSAGICCGIKKKKRDVALIYSERPAVAAGVFTTNKITAAPVRLSKSHLSKGMIRAIIANSGNANCLTGKRGYKDAEAMARVTAGELGIKSEEVLVASTGVIGKMLPVERIKEGAGKLVRKLGDESIDAAKAIMTTDTFPKMAAVRTGLPDNSSIGAIAKGSGMICPQLATMLCFITTDVSINRNVLREALSKSVKQSFNRITVDGDMSTNDTVFILANGASCGERIIAGNSLRKFQEALDIATLSLAKMIVKDGEGAEKTIELTVRGAGGEKEAKRICAKIANSNLVKTALERQAPNWGRIIAAAGACGVELDEEKIGLYIGKEALFLNGAPHRFNRKIVGEAMKARELKITIDIGRGKSNCKMWTCNLTERYVRINKLY